MQHMSREVDGVDHSYAWPGSWKLQAAVVVFFTFGLVQPLRSSAPLVAIYFPGGFLAIGIWTLLRMRMQWSPVRRPLLTNLPVVLYLLIATSTLFVAHLVTDRPVYLRTGLASLLLTIPAAAASAFLLAAWHRTSKHDRTDASDLP
jgi:hypothetical protein